jgi:4-hydroxy-tetrahydrodipicolinate synthase
MQSSVRFGLSCALALPFKNDFTIDHGRLAAQARWCLDAGCSSVTVFGTTGEGASVSVTERGEVLGALLSAGVEPEQQLVGGVAAASIGDAVEQIRMLNDAGCQRILLAPPFYFKGVSEEGLYDWFARVGQKIAHRPLGVILYHIPSVTQVPLTVDLVGRLKTAYPDLVMGVKDSGGDWAFTEALLTNHGDLAILVGDERHLSAGVQLGAKGAISGLANICPAEVLPLAEHGKNDSRIVDLVNEIVKYPVTAAVKALLARSRNDAAWFNVRPPLARISNQDTNQLASAYDRIFSQEPRSTASTD